MFQSTVLSTQADGIIGELALDGPLNAAPGILASADAANNVIGRAFTYVSASAAPVDAHTKTVQAGGTTPFAGILANPKAYALRGTPVGGALAASLVLPNGEIGELVQQTPGLFVQFTGAANVGDQVAYVNASGALVAVAPGTAPAAGQTIIPGAVVVREPTTTGALAIIALNGPLPVPADATA